MYWTIFGTNSIWFRRFCFLLQLVCTGFYVGRAQSDQDKVRPLTDLLNMYPAVFGLNFDISSIDISRSSARKYPVFLLVWLSKTNTKYWLLINYFGMYWTIFGTNFNLISTIIFFFFSGYVQLYLFWMMVELSKTKAKHWLFLTCLAWTGRFCDENGISSTYLWWTSDR